MTLPPINLWNAPRLHSSRTMWHCEGPRLVCSRNGLSVSVDAPMDYAYTHARAWKQLLVQALWLAEMKLELEEHKERR